MGNRHMLSFSPIFRVSLAITLLAAILAALLTACTAAISPQTDSLRTLEIDPSASNQPLPAQAESQVLSSDAASTPAQIPMEDRLPTRVTMEAPCANHVAETPPAIDFGTADLAIVRPGKLSRHTSPIRVIANLNTTLPMQTEITLFGEDGRVLASKMLWSKPYNDPINGNLITDIEFSLPGMAETGRLELKAFDSNSRVWALNSVYLILLSSGITDRNYAAEDQERILLQLPFPDQRQIDSSPIFISGLVRTDSDVPLTIWLIDAVGNIVGEGQASVVLSPNSPYGQFVGEIPYQVASSTPVVMTFGMQEGRIPGFTYIKTIEFTLQPANN